MSTFFLTIPRLAYLLSEGSIFRFVKISMGLWSVLFYQSMLKKDISLPMSFAYKGTQFKLRIQNKFDIAVLKEIFLFKEYEWNAIEDPRVIIDLGAHIGDTSLYYHCVYPEATIYAVEPDPRLFARLKENTLGIKNIIAVHAAVSDTTGTAAFAVSSESSLRGSLTERMGNDLRIEVPTITLGELYSLHGIGRADLFKFDIEGAEKSMFGSRNAIEYADAYIGELHCDLAGITPEEFLSFFGGFDVEMKPMRRSNRFSIKAAKKS